MLHGVEWDRKRKVRQTGMDAALLADWHLVFFEVEVINALLEHANKKIVRELVLVRKARSRNGLKALQKILVSLVALGDGRKRVLGKLVIVTIVAKARGSLRCVAKIGLILLFKESILCSQPVSNRFGVLGEGRNYYCDE